MKSKNVKSMPDTRSNMYRLDDVTKHRIIFLKEEGYTVTEIAESLGLTRKTVYLWWHRYEQEGVLKNHTSVGRPRKTCAYDDRKIVEKVQEGGRVTTTDLAHNFSVSASTIRRRLHDLGVQKTPVRKAILSPRHKTQRLNFAKKYLDHDFSNAIFIDLKIVNSIDGKISLGRKQKRRLNCKSTGLNLTMSFWGWISMTGTGHLTDVKNRLSSDDYISILQDIMIPTASAFQTLPIHFVQDGGASYRSRFVREWIKKQENLVEIALPPKSPDLNPVQTVWDRIIRAWDGEKVKDFASLKAHVMELWSSYHSLCSEQVGTMRQRLQSVIDNDGGYTQF